MRRFFVAVSLCLWFVVLTPMLLLLFYPPSRQWPAGLIYREDSVPTPADAIVVLMGSVKERAKRASELWKEGRAPKIVFVEAERTFAIPGIRAPDGEASELYLQSLGIPQDAIVFDRNTAISSTAEEAEAVLALVKRRLPAAKNLILTTSWYHSSRATWIFQKSNKAGFDYALYSLPSPKPENWYQREADFLMVFNEYLKWTYYLFSY